MDEEQVRKLVRIMTSCAMTIHNSRDYFDGKSSDEVGAWMSEQLKECGFPNGPAGMLHIHLDRSLFKQR